MIENETTRPPKPTVAGLFTTVTRPAFTSQDGTLNTTTTATSRLVGFASSNHAMYDGLGGIGMDFDGRDYEEEEEGAKKAKKKKRRKKGDDSDDD